MENQLKDLTSELSENLDLILSYTQDERLFSVIFEDIPTDSKIIDKYISRKYNVEEGTIEFLDILKPILEQFDKKYEVRDIVSKLGESREEVLVNLGRVVIKSEGLTEIYRGFLREKLGINKSSGISVRKSFGRRNLSVDPITSIYEKMKIQETDSKYLNIFGGNN